MPRNELAEVVKEIAEAEIKVGELKLLADQAPQNSVDRSKALGRWSAEVGRLAQLRAKRDRLTG